MKKPKHIVVTATFTAVFKVDPNLTIDQQRHELECNFTAMYDKAYMDGAITKDTECEYLHGEESTSSFAI